MQITYALADTLRVRVFALAYGCPDAGDLGDLRRNPAFNPACGRLPESDDGLASEPTLSRWKNAPGKRALIRPSHALMGLWSSNRCRALDAVTLDIDDTPDAVHGH